jgi:predicted secreted Zn-dependent protease
MKSRPWIAPLLAALALGLGACAGGTDRPAASPPAREPDFAGIPNVSFEYYDVVGNDPASIRRSINERRPIDSNDGSRVDALTTGSVDFGLSRQGNGRCKPGDVSARLRLRVLLPRLRDTSGLDPTVIERWNAFVAALKKHEAWHVRYAHDHMPDLEAAMRATDCAHARDAAAKALAAIGRAQLEYDRTTHHGADQGISFP